MAEITVQARWLVTETDLPLFANQTGVQVVSPDEGAYIMFGHLNPPIFEAAPGTELTQEMVEGRTFPVVPIARILIPYARLVELRQKIDDALAANAASNS